MTQTRVFRISEGQSVALPKSMAFPDSVKHVDISKLGNARLITPVDAAWDCFFDGPDVSEDFMTCRGRPSAVLR